MASLILLVLLIIGAFILTRRGKSKSDSFIHYKPFDAMINGTGDHFTTESVNDSKHNIQYEEKTKEIEKEL
ncbi:hypothetical protein [Bacillus suaedaesalsae]|uniref:DUF3951 domain-containing protein n=1 Tax=Bacillus suaedaesalsae TaxID=2810349 RepID=A0ABS2DJN7_9BACI|nr:hypothetical protein [Bacillus suaedaesalsae]MBM6618707.1 hypothetical protein [Bacillus suaedaesalsae]